MKENISTHKSGVGKINEVMKSELNAHFKSRF